MPVRQRAKGVPAPHFDVVPEFDDPLGQLKKQKPSKAPRDQAEAEEAARIDIMRSFRSSSGDLGARPVT